MDIVVLLYIKVHSAQKKSLKMIISIWPNCSQFELKQYKDVWEFYLI